MLWPNGGCSANRWRNEPLCPSVWSRPAHGCVSFSLVSLSLPGWFKLCSSREEFALVFRGDGDGSTLQRCMVACPRHSPVANFPVGFNDRAIVMSATVPARRWLAHAEQHWACAPPARVAFLTLPLPVWHAFFYPDLTGRDTCIAHCHEGAPSSPSRLDKPAHLEACWRGEPDAHAASHTVYGQSIRNCRPVRPPFTHSIITNNTTFVGRATG